MLNMIFPMTIAIIGYFLANIGGHAHFRLFTVIGSILIFVAIIWFIWNTGYNIGYMLY